MQSTVSTVDRDCPDGLDCPYYWICKDGKETGEVCPFFDREPDRNEPIDKQIKEW
jgi:hypothetical protein